MKIHAFVAVYGLREATFFQQEGDNTLIEVGTKTAINGAFFMISESGSRISIGQGCMFSWAIQVRTSDGHSIIDERSGERTNKSKDVIIKDGVWVGQNCIILKGVEIGKGSVIGAGSVVTRKFLEDNVAIAGNPAKVIKKGITWRVEKI